MPALCATGPVKAQLEHLMLSAPFPQPGAWQAAVVLSPSALHAWDEKQRKAPETAVHRIQSGLKSGQQRS